MARQWDFLEGVKHPDEIRFDFSSDIVAAGQYMRSAAKNIGNPLSFRGLPDTGARVAYLALWVSAVAKSKFTETILRVMALITMPAGNLVPTIPTPSP